MMQHKFCRIAQLFSLVVSHIVPPHEIWSPTWLHLPHIPPPPLLPKNPMPTWLHVPLEIPPLIEAKITLMLPDAISDRICRLKQQTYTIFITAYPISLQPTNVGGGSKIMKQNETWKIRKHLQNPWMFLYMIFEDWLCWISWLWGRKNGK